jgi:hypothetical protein
MTYHEILREIHKSHYEHDVLIYLSKWMNQENDRILIENCELRSSLSLLKKFNDAKWHDELIGALVNENGKVMID